MFNQKKLIKYFAIINTIIILLTNQMGKHGKTSGNGYINGAANQNGGYIEAGGNITHKPNDNTTVQVGGNINRTQPYNGKGTNGGEVNIGVTTTW
jgi:hypothetical protein